MPWRDLRQFLQELGEAIRERDEKYRERRSRGRALKIYYKRVRETTPSGNPSTREIKLLHIKAVPARVLSILSKVKQEVYNNVIPRHCERLELIQAYGARRVIYFIPEYNLEPFIDSLKSLNQNIREANKILKEYAESPHLKRINNILRRYGFQPLPEPEKVPPIEYDLAPLIFDPDVVKQWIENKELVQTIEQKIKEKQRKIIEKAVERLKSRVNELIAQIRSEQFTEQAAKQAIKEISRIAETVGLQSIIAPTLKHLETSIEHPHQLDPKIAKQLNQRIKTLLENL